METRYFKSLEALWKFECGKHPQIRTSISSQWADSVFATLDEFLAEPGHVVEIAAGEAEAEQIGC
ncbi:MAG: hypothetical protein V4819_13940 [Verrucomicrobiota bacterium]